jgi:hypothetical protein
MILSFTQAVVFHRPRQTSIRDNQTQQVSGEINLNLFGSHRDYENSSRYDGSPPQGLSETRRVWRHSL